MAFTSDRLAKQLAISPKEAEEILKDLCSLQIIHTLEVDVEEGNSTYYKTLDYYPSIVSLVPFLFATSDLIERAVCCFNNTSGTVQSIL